MSYTPLTGRRCTCRPGVQRDNCPRCEGTGNEIDFRKIHEARAAKLPPTDKEVTGGMGQSNQNFGMGEA